MNSIEQILEKQATVEFFKAPTGEYRNYPRYQKGEGWGLADVGQMNVFIHISNANYIKLDESGPELDVIWGRFDNFSKATHFIDPPKEGDKIILLAQESSIKSGRLQTEATNWLPLSEAQKIIDAIRSATRFRVRMIVSSTEGKTRDKVLVEGNNESFIITRFHAESKKRGELSLGGKTIRTEIEFEKLENGTWVKSYG